VEISKEHSRKERAAKPSASSENLCAVPGFPSFVPLILAGGNPSNQTTTGGRREKSFTLLITVRPLLRREQCKRGKKAPERCEEKRTRRERKTWEIHKCHGPLIRKKSKTSDLLGPPGENRFASGTDLRGFRKGEYRNPIDIETNPTPETGK